MSRKKLIIIITSSTLAALVIGGLIYWRYNSIHALNPTTSSLTANLSVKINENNLPALGVALLSSGCSETKLVSNNGVFSCKLQSSDDGTGKQVILLGQLTFSPYTFGQAKNQIAFTVPLSGDSGGDSVRGVTVVPNQYIQIQIDVKPDSTKAGQSIVTLSQWQNGALNNVTNSGINGDGTVTTVANIGGSIAVSNLSVPTPTSGTTGSGTAATATVSITSPTNNTNISGTVTVKVSASGIVKAELYVDNNLKYSSSKSPFTLTWNSSTAARGSHSILVKGYDSSGNVVTSPTITVNKTR